MNLWNKELCFRFSVTVGVNWESGNLKPAFISRFMDCIGETLFPVDVSTYLFALIKGVVLRQNNDRGNIGGNIS